MPTATKPAKANNGTAAAVAHARQDLPPARDGYKHTKLGWIPEEWEVLRGKEIAALITKGSSPKWQGFDYQKSGVLFVTSENVRDGFLDVSSPKYLPQSFSDKQRNSILHCDDLLINIVGASIGRSCRYDRSTPANINQAVAIVRLKQEYDPCFVALFLQLPGTIARLVGTQTESARPNLTLAELALFEFILPPVPEQRRIATILGTWDKAIGQLQELIAAKQRRKQGLMQELLSGRRRFPGFTRPWCETEIGTLGRFRTSSVDKKNVEGEEAVDLVNYMDVYNNDRIQRGMSFMRVTAKASQIQNSDVRKGDILFTPSSETPDDIGHSAVVLEDLHGTVFSYHVMRFRPNDGSLSLGYRAYVFNNPSILRQFSAKATGSTRYTLSAADFSDTMVKFPEDVREQDAITATLAQADWEIDHHEQQLTHLTIQKRGLMQQLLTGTVRVHNTNSYGR